MPISVDLKPCLGCGEGADCDLRKFATAIQAEAKVYDEGKAKSVNVPEGVGAILESSITHTNPIEDSKTNEYTCLEGNGTLTVVVYSASVTAD